MTREDFPPRDDDTTFASWHGRVCPEEHALLKTVSATGCEGEIMRAALAEGRLSILYVALTQWPHIHDAHELVRLLLADQHALNERRIAVGAVRALLGDIEQGGSDER
jgi:hypothetical protein